MEKITITIDGLGNAAFEENGLENELARILRRMADVLEDGLLPHSAIDINGNKVGTVEYE